LFSCADSKEQARKVELLSVKRDVQRLLQRHVWCCARST